MTYRMNDIASQHIHELRHEADRRRCAARPQETSSRGTRPSPWLRRHVGFALVEAGFYVLGTRRLAAHD